MPASRSPRRDVSTKRPPRRWPLILLGIIALAAAAVFVLPASMITHFLPAQVHAADFSGSLVHGAAGKLEVNARDAGAIEWQLHPLSLLRMAIVADIHWVKVGFVLDGTVTFAGHALAGHDIKGGGPIEDLHDLGVAPGWKGSANLAIAEFKSDLRKLDAAVGKLELANLSAAQIADGEALGGYVLQLAPGAIASDGTITANLNDNGGPLEAQAQIQYSPAARTGMLSGTLKERPEASLGLRNQLSSLSQLRPRDPAGRLPVELEFTL
ncbi:MAG: type II secretion system protein N [Pseudomonadota bacterium]|nr:type II secretion system protein N [Pseudomonadota bacterium]